MRANGKLERESCFQNGENTVKRGRASVASIAEVLVTVHTYIQDISSRHALPITKHSEWQTEIGESCLSICYGYSLPSPQPNPP